MSVDYVEINGYKVPAQYADMFYHGSDGSFLTDAEWDEQIRRIRVFEPDFSIPKVD